MTWTKKNDRIARIRDEVIDFVCDDVTTRELAKRYHVGKSTVYNDLVYGLEVAGCEIYREVINAKLKANRKRNQFQKREVKHE